MTSSRSDPPFHIVDSSNAMREKYLFCLQRAKALYIARHPLDTPDTPPANQPNPNLTVFVVKRDQSGAGDRWFEQQAELQQGPVDQGSDQTGDKGTQRPAEL